MYLAWQIQDLQHLIFDRLEPRDLARVARTCKAFFEIATDHLWQTVHSFSPFLFCLPRDFRHRTLRIEDVNRLDFYAAKVRNLILVNRISCVRKYLRLHTQFKVVEPKYVVHKTWEKIWGEISELRPASEFLPNLCHLRISNVVEEFLIPLIGLSGSHLTQVYIRYFSRRPSKSLVVKFLNGIQDTSKLEYLFVRDGEPRLIPSKLIQQSPLKHLRLDPRNHVDASGSIHAEQHPLRHEILQISTLKHLTLGLSREWHSSEIEALRSGYLPSLKSLWLSLIPFTPLRRLPCRESCINANPHSWTCVGDGIIDCANFDGATDCGRRSPTVFLEGLDNPALSLLSIKFPPGITGKMFLDVVSAAKNNCRLTNLTELALAGGKWCFHYTCWRRPDQSTNIKPAELREAIAMLLPMSQLKILRLSAAPNFLDILDLELYRSITAGLPALEVLCLGYQDFNLSSDETVRYKGVPLYRLAAFCSMLPKLTEVSIRSLDGFSLKETPRTDWTSLSVKRLIIHHWTERHIIGGVSQDMLLLGLRTYFPNSDLAIESFDP
jgi:F-box-like